MPYQRGTTGIAPVDREIDKLYQLLSSLRYGTMSIVSSASNGLINEYADHASVPTPSTGKRVVYFLTGDNDFLYIKWSDGSRHNRRIPLNFEVDE